MKKVIYTIFALSAVMACSKMSEGKQEVPQVKDEQSTSEILPGVKYEEFTINTESQTKTTLEGVSCKWSVGDKLSVVTNYEGQTTSNSFAMGQGKTDGVFTGQVPEGTTEFFAIYGNGASYNMSNGNLSATVTVPTTQTAVKDGFDPNAHIAVGYGVKQAEGASSAHLANFIRLVMVSVPENVTSVTLSSNTAIAGSMTLNCTSEGALTMSGNANANSVTLNASNDVIEPGTYYLCVAPVDMVGFQMVYTFTDGSTYTKTSEKTLAMASSTQIRNLKLTIPAPTAADLAPAGFFTTFNYGTGDGVTKNVAKANGMTFSAVDECGIECRNGWGRINNNGVTYNVDGGDFTSIANAPTLTVWKSYEIRVKASLGCQEVESETSITRHITGLPYSAASKADFDDWKKENTSWNNGGYLKIHDGVQVTSSYAQFDRFYVPSDITVTVHSKYAAGFATTATNFEIYVSGARILEFKGKGGAFNTGGNSGESDNNGKLTSISPVIKCSNTWNAGASHCRLYNISVKYR